jgi:HEAT repeat protein
METNMSLSIEELIADLANSDKPLSRVRLTELSNLSLEGVVFLSRVWMSIGLKRRQQIIYRLIELAEDNFELNFDSILENCLKDQDDEVRSKPIDVRRRALEAVAPLSLTRVKKVVMEAYQSHNAQLRASAVYAIGKSCNRSWLLIILKELANADTEIRYEAAGACGELGEEEAIPYLIELISDPDTNVQLATIQAIGKIGGSEARECLEECRSNPGEVIQEAAEQALEETKTVGALFSFEA